MIRLSILACSAFVFLGCSFSSPPNVWQHKSASAFSSYTKNFLQAHDALAKNDLDRARSHAKMGADLSQLARIELGRCALNISVGIHDSCSKYVELQELVNSKELDAYYAFLTQRVSIEQIALLNDSYQDFAEALHNVAYEKAIDELYAIERPSSKLVAAALIKEQLSNADKEMLIEFVSFHGYKRAALFWLEELIKTSNNEEKIILQKKLDILQINN